MYTTNFEYDGIKLSDFGMMVCTFDSSGGVETLSSGADITFNTVKPTGSNKFKFIDSKYEESYSKPFQICRDVCVQNKDSYLSANEVSGLQRWLCRKDGFHPFKPIQDDLKDTFWNATFSCQEILIGGQIVGLELTMHTDSPYAYLNIGTISYSPVSGESFSLYDMSDEVGFIYPLVTLYCEAEGSIQLKNSLDKKILQLNVLSGETITLDGENKIINSDMRTQEELASNFNFYFPRIFNTFTNRENVYTLSSDNSNFSCKITFSYNPIVKVGL